MFFSRCSLFDFTLFRHRSCHPTSLAKPRSLVWLLLLLARLVHRLDLYDAELGFLRSSTEWALPFAWLGNKSHIPVPIDR